MHVAWYTIGVPTAVRLVRGVGVAVGGVEPGRDVRLLTLFLSGAIVELMIHRTGRSTAPLASHGRHRRLSVEEVREALAAAGCRFTAQRGAVWSYLAGVEDHPTAEQVYHAVRRRIPQISLATVYNALEALVQARLATKISSGDGSARYDCRGEDHYHLRDVETGEVRDLPAQFDRKLLDKLDPRLCERLAEQVGFTVTGYRLEVLGRFENGPGSKAR
jgi:Fe2+ or Zn2+ uptake regulation protein